MSLLGTAKSLLRAHRIRPKRLLGQNFMIEPRMFARMASYASLNKNDTVLDVGAGMGFLTKFLAEQCRAVIAVEADANLADILREQLAGVYNAEIIEGNVLKAAVPSFNKVVSIPPYGISSRLLLWLFERDFESAVLVFQKEFAKRLVASVGHEDYGWLTVFAFYHAEINLLDAVPKSMFHPQPEVDSMLVRFEPRKPCSAIRSEAAFRQFIQFLFTQRNRKVRGAVASYLKDMHKIPKENVKRLINALPWDDRRVRHLSPEDFGELADAVLR